MKRALLLLPLIVGCAQTEEVEVVKAPKDLNPKQVAISPVKEKQPLQPVNAPVVKTSMLAQIDTEGRWARNENAKISLTIINHGTQPSGFTLRSGMAADFELVKDGNVVWRYSEQMMFIQALQPVEIAAGAQRQFSVMIPKADLTSLASGSYQLLAKPNVVESGIIPKVAPVSIELY